MIKTIKMPHLAEIGRTEALNRQEWETLGRLCATIEMNGAKELSQSLNNSVWESASPDDIRGHVEAYIRNRMKEEGLNAGSPNRPPFDPAIWIIQAHHVPDHSEPESLANWKVSLWCRRRTSEAPVGDYRPTIAEQTKIDPAESAMKPVIQGGSSDMFGARQEIEIDHVDTIDPAPRVPNGGHVVFFRTKEAPQKGQLLIQGTRAWPILDVETFSMLFTTEELGTAFRPHIHTVGLLVSKDLPKPDPGPASITTEAVAVVHLDANDASQSRIEMAPHDIGPLKIETLEPTDRTLAVSRVWFSIMTYNDGERPPTGVIELTTNLGQFSRSVIGTDHRGYDEAVRAAVRTGAHFVVDYNSREQVLAWERSIECSTCAPCKDLRGAVAP